MTFSVISPLRKHQINDYLIDVASLFVPKIELGTSLHFH